LVTNESASEIYKCFTYCLPILGLPYVQNFLDMSGILALTSVSGNNFFKCFNVWNFDSWLIMNKKLNVQDWVRKTCLFCILSFVAYCVTILWYFYVVVTVFCSGLVVVSTYWKLPHRACLLSWNVAIETVRTFASSDIVTLANMLLQI